MGAAAGKAPPARALWALILLGSGCAQGVRLQRALSPESFVTPQAELGEQATVTVESGWEDEPAKVYTPEAPVFERDGVRWVAPVSITDRGTITIEPTDGPVTMSLYARHVGLDRTDFEPFVARSGTIPRALPTTLRFEPHGPVSDKHQISMRDLHSIYGGAALEDGDLLLLEVAQEGKEPERYLFSTLDFGWRTRVGAGLLVRVPLPWVESQEGAELSPVLTASLIGGYRFRTRQGGLLLLSEQIALVGSLGIGSTEVALPGGDQRLNDQVQGVFNAALIGGGLEFFQFLSVQVLGNASAPFRSGGESNWALATGLDTVQLARFSRDLISRLVKDRPLLEDREAP
jgi:hypothetical protein